MDIKLIVPAGVTVTLTEEAPAPSPAPTPAPAPAPVPAPPPPAPAPAPAVDSTVKFEPIADLTKFIIFKDYCYGDRYDRFQTLVRRQRSAAMEIWFRTASFVSGGIQFGQPMTLTLEMDGQPIAVVSVAANATEGKFVFDSRNVSTGKHRFKITGAPAPWATASFFFDIVDGADVGPQSTTVVTLATYGLTHLAALTGATEHQYATVPGVFNPVLLPLVPKARPHFSTTPARSALVMTELVKCRPDDIYRPVLSADGIVTTANQQPYFRSDMQQKYPRLALLDGPRGRASLSMVTHLQVGRNGKVYFCDPWRFGVVDQTGYVRTLSGYRHKSMASYYVDPQDLELVGDWSAIPADRRGFRETWGNAWDARTLATDPNVVIGGENAHLGAGPVCYITDSENGRVLKHQFSATNRETPPVVTEYLTGLRFPWGIVAIDGVLIVSERDAHKVVAYDIDSAAVLWTVTTYTAVDGTIKPMLGPEGLRLMDNVLYIGSKVSRSVWKMPLATKVAVPFRDMTPFIDNNSLFVDLAVSDGTFGPRGMVMTVTWSNNGYGWPHMFSPSGSEITYLWGSGTYKGLPWLGQAGRPAPYYPSAVAIGDGCAVMGGSQEGLIMLSQAQASDLPTDSNKHAAGLKKWYAKGYQLTHGHDGFGFFGLPLPWTLMPICKCTGM